MILAVLANKQDIDGAMSVAEVAVIMQHNLGYELLKNRTIEIFGTSAITGEGLDKVMDWISITLQNKEYKTIL